MIPTAIQALGIAVLLLALPPVAPAAGVLKEPWGPEQAAGAPDTIEAEDAPTAWCPLEPDAGAEWLLVHFEKKLSIAEVRVRESFNPGAVARMSALSKDSASSLLWEGQAPVSTSSPGDFVVRVAGEVTGQSILLELDTARRPGWSPDDLRGHAAAALDLLGAEVQAWEVHGFSGLRALGLVAAGTGELGGGPKMKQHWVAVPREQDVLLFLLSAPEASFGAAERIFEKMLATVEIDRKK